jgi:8-oxo-dGTP diphosphatase
MPEYHPPAFHVAADIVIYTVRERRLEVLLIQRGRPPFQGCWAVPGGFVEVDEDVDRAAHRELEEETGVSGLRLEQFHALGAPGRDPRGRVVSVAYFTLVAPEHVKPRAADDAANAQWFDADKLPSLAFDHGEMLTLARRRLSAEIEVSALAAPLLPKQFALAELRSLHELARGERLDPARFRKRILALEIIEETGKSRKTAGRSARLYRFKRRGTA